MVDRAALRAKLVERLGYAPPDDELEEIGGLVEAVEPIESVAGEEGCEPAPVFVPLPSPGPEG